MKKIINSKNNENVKNTYRSKIINAKLHATELSEFCKLAEEIYSGIVTVSQENSLISGKSLMNLMTLDLNKPVKIILQGSYSNEYLSKFDKYKIKKSN